MPGSGYVLLHHVMGETDGNQGIWAYVSLVSLVFLVIMIMEHRE